MHNLHAHATMCMLECVCMYVLSVSLKNILWPVLSADRVEQMTKTYNDIEVVTHLLAEVGVPLLYLGTLLKKQHLIG